MKRIKKVEKEFLFSLGLKYCPKCSEIKELVSFSKDNSRVDKKAGMCKECVFKHRNIESIKKHNREIGKIWYKNARQKTTRPKIRQKTKRPKRPKITKEEKRIKLIKYLKIPKVQASKRYSKIHQRCNNPKDVHYSRYGAKGIECLISRERYVELFLKSDKCPICGDLFNSSDPKKRISTHRKDNNKGYVEGNIIFICILCHGYIHCRG